MSQKIQWRTVTISHHAIMNDAFVGVLDALGAEGIQEFDALTKAPDGLELSDDEAIIIATFPKRDALERDVMMQLLDVSKHFPNTPTPELVWADLENQDWTATFKESWTAEHFVEDYWVVPSWDKNGFPEGSKPIYIDPEMAFGTGQHPTTRLCASAMIRQIQTATPKAMLDVGTGTGILSFIAADLGIPTIHGIDNDPLAVQAAINNTKDNIHHTGVEIDFWQDWKRAGLYDFVVVNIISEILIELAEHVAKHTAPGGRLILSGMLSHQVESVKHTYEGCGFQFFNQATGDGDWNSLEGQKES